MQIAGHSLLPPDETVRMCPDAIAVSRAEVATRDTTPYAPEHLAAINLSRKARALAPAAGAQLRRGVRDPGLRAETEAWLELRRTLM
ncbi:hypothetical protein ACFU98_24400 [Streptomyces sp. NPDC057575]|uniref:hypothetical protein n=1 Tax=unclassified Streptomyces TaxID=2593676 RepID=UPI0036869CF9